MILYRNILKQSLKISWNNKYLWFFGLFAAFLGNSGDFGLISQQTSGNLINNVKRYIETGIFKGSVISNIGYLLKNETMSIIILFCVGLVILALICFFIWLTIISQISLVDASAKIITSKSKNKSSIKEGIKIGKKEFWPILILNAVAKIIMVSIFFIISLPILFLTTKSTVISGTIFIILFILLVPIALIFSFIIKYAICYKVIREEKLIDSIKSGWGLFKKNWLISIEISFLLFFINFIFGLSVIFGILILSIPFLFLAFLIYNFLSAAGFLFVIAFGFILILIIIIVAGSMLATFQTASWTGLYLALGDNKVVSKIVRSVENFKK